jgi:hypothetical protein
VMLPSLERRDNSATRCRPAGEGWNATTASGVVPAAMNSMISSNDWFRSFRSFSLVHAGPSPQGKL